MKCPNSNKIFNSFFYDTGLIDKNLPPELKAYERRRVYYTICIVFRLLIAGLLLQFRDKIWLPYFVAFISFFASINLYFFRTEDNQWWSNKFSLTINLLLFIFSVLIILEKVPTWSLAFIMYFSILGGIFQSLLIPSC